MVGVTASIELDSVAAEAALARLSSLQAEGLVDGIGALLESSTKERIATGKAAPDGTPWLPWTEAYADTRSARHSLLIGEGNPGLLESVQNYSTGLEAVVGTNLVYGAVHQFGSADDSTRKIPARPYLGVSDQDETDIANLVVDTLEELLQ